MVSRRPSRNRSRSLSHSLIDSDGDGVPNRYDCQPFNPHKQGVLHDKALSFLRKKEEFFEKRRETQLKKLSDQSDKLKERLASQQAIQSKKNKILAQKQAIINETTREKQKIVDLKKINKEAKRQLFKSSFAGKTISGIEKFGKISVKTIKNSEKTLKKIERFIN